MFGKLTSLGRQLLLRAQLGAPPLIQKTVISPFSANKELFRLVVQPYFDIYQLHGQNEAGPLTVTYTGTKASTRYLRQQIFSENSTMTKVGQVSVWQTHKVAEASDTDIVIVETDKRLIKRLPRQKAIIMPSYIHMVIDLRGSWEDVRKGFRKTVREDLRLVRKYDYTYRISHDWQDFENFYHNMYLPTMRDRHGKFNSAMSKSEAAIYFSRGYLSLIERNGTDVAGGLWHPKAKAVDFVLLGVLNADVKLIKEGVLGAGYIFGMQWANENGFETMNLLGCPPYLVSNNFYYKRKWGAKVITPVNETKQVWLKIKRYTPAVSRFLKDNPAVTVGEQDTLQGLIITDNPANISSEEKNEWQQKYVTPGLERMVVCSVTDLMDNSFYESPAEMVVVPNIKS